MKVKRLFNLGMVIMMLVTSFAVSQPAAAQAPAKFTPRITPGAEAVPGEIVVAFADSQDKNLVEKIEQAVDTANDAGGEVTRLSLDGSAVIQVDGDTTTALTELNDQPDVLYAELNYVYSVTPSEEPTDEYKASSDFVFREVTPSASTNGMSIMAVPNSTIQGMVAMGTLPTDTYLSNNQGWFNMGADIVWPNATASANICEVDTGVDYLHPDFWYSYRVRKRVGGVYRWYTYYVYRVYNGYDFVNGDALPLDDNGHGTHVAGIMVALKNNGVGVSGVSTGYVVSVKALDAQGTGTNFDIAKAIKYCADRTDVRVINLSLGGPATSAALESALLYATTPTTDIVPGNPPLPGCVATNNCVYGKGKLVVAAAGNGGGLDESYPAAYAVDPDFPNNRILSVGATGKLLSSFIHYDCRATFSNYGNWVTVAAPGMDIYSTTPYDKPFYQNYISAVATRYDYESGTSQAAAFVSATAARRMGYKPLETSEQVGTAVKTTGDPMDTVTGSCTEAEMASVKRVNVATLLDRAAVRVSVFDASAGTPLNGATVGVNFLNAGVSTWKTAVIAPDTYKPLPGEDIDPNRVYTDYISRVDVLDVPTVGTNGLPISNYTLNVYMPGYTVGWQNIFQQDNLSTLTAGTFNVFSNGAVPPLSSSFNVVLGWHKWQQPGYKAATSLDDLDLYVWLPDDNLNTDPGQPASFVVGYGGDSFGLTHVEGDPYGTMTDFPFTRMKREGGFIDGGPTVETTTVLQRVARTGGTVLANANLPYYAGAYTIMATDYGQTIDHDNDGCGDNYGYTFKAPKIGGGAGYYDPTTDSDCPPNDVTGTLGVPLLGAYFTPYAYVWKDGVVKYFQNSENNLGPWAAEIDPTEDANKCNDHWWKGFTIFSTTTSTAPAYSAFSTAGGKPLCDDGLLAGFIPYSGYTNTDATDRLYITGLGK